MCLAFSKHLRLAVVAMVEGVFSAPSSTPTHSPWFRLGVLGVGGGALSQAGGHQHQLPAALPPPQHPLSVHSSLPQHRLQEASLAAS